MIIRLSLTETKSCFILLHAFKKVIFHEASIINKRSLILSYFQSRNNSVFIFRCWIWALMFTLCFILIDWCVFSGDLRETTLKCVISLIFFLIQKQANNKKLKELREEFWKGWRLLNFMCILLYESVVLSMHQRHRLVHEREYIWSLFNDFRHVATLLFGNYCT